MAFFLPRSALMATTEIICQHCGGSTAGKVYRVMSEEDGVILLDMIVCRPCYIEARKLRLKTVELSPSERRNLETS